MEYFMKILIKLVVLALGITQINASAINNSKILNTYRLFSTPEKKQQFQTRSFLLPWAGITLTAGIGGGLFHYYVGSSVRIPGVANQIYTYATAKRTTKNLENVSSNLDAIAPANFGDKIKLKNAARSRTTELSQIPTLHQTIGTSMKYTGIGLAIAPFIHGMYTGNKESLGMAAISIASAGAGVILEKFKITNR